jgi:hemoglobin
MQIIRTSLVGATLAALLALGGCAMQQAQPAPTPTLYERLGGKAAITAAVDDAMTNIAADSRINQRFGSTDIARLKSELVDLICIRTGGPCTYSGRNMSDAHEGMHIRDDEFDALVQDLVKSLDKYKVPDREKGELLSILGQMRNSIVGH